MMSIVSHMATADSGKGAGTHTIGSTDYDFSAFVVDDSIRAFNQGDLETKLAASSFFVMVEIEGSLIGWDATSQGIVKAYVENGGVLLMAGTPGGRDADFLNAAFGWDTSSTRCSGSTAAKNAAGAAGTPFELDGSSSISTVLSATDCLNCGTASCTPLYGTADKAMVVAFEFGRGKVIYVGWDYYNAGMVATIPDGWKGGANTVEHPKCGAADNPLAAEIFPLMLFYAKTLAEEPAYSTTVAVYSQVRLACRGV